MEPISSFAGRPGAWPILLVCVSWHTGRWIGVKLSQLRAKFRRHEREIGFCECLDEFGMYIVVHEIGPGRSGLAGIEIVVRNDGLLPVSMFAQRKFEAIERGVEARFKLTLRLWRRSPQLQNLQRPKFR